LACCSSRRKLLNCRRFLRNSSSAFCFRADLAFSSLE
jgi:hypothetical protein